MDVRRGQTARRHRRWRLQATARRRVLWMQREPQFLPPLDEARPAPSREPADEENA